MASKDYSDMAANKTIKTSLIILGLSILLVSCKFRSNPRVENSYENPDSDLIETLLTEQELSEISNEFSWHSILSKQSQSVLDPDTSSYYEVSDRMYRGYFQNSDQLVTIWHTIMRYDTSIDKNKLTTLEFVGAFDNDVTSTYIPNIGTSAVATPKCITLRQTRQICEVDVKYNYIESIIYLWTDNLDGEDILSDWLDAIVSAVEPRIVLQDFGK